MERDRRQSTIGADQPCDHPREDRRYLGHMGSASFHRCAACDGVLVTWPDERDAAAPTPAD